MLFMIASTMLQGDFFFYISVTDGTSGMHYQKQTEVIWCFLSSKRGLWPVSPIECNLSGALCYLISFCCSFCSLSICLCALGLCVSSMQFQSEFSNLTYV